jgi:hypothetical protein
LAFGYEGIASCGWLMPPATAAAAQQRTYEQPDAIERCRGQTLNSSALVSHSCSLYFNIYNAGRQAIFVWLIEGVTEL